MIIGIKISYHSEKITDINNYDDSIYILRGITFNPLLKSHLDGLFYYIWIKILSVFTNNNIELYYLNNQILLVLPAIILFVFLRVINVNLLIAFISSSFFLVSSANVFVIPLITKFALCIILTGFIFLYKIKNLNKKLLFSVFLSAILVYIRPEFFLTFMVTAVIYIIYVFKNYESEGKLKITGKLLPVLLITVMIIFFNPVSRHRANVAFAQHYSMDIQERELYRFANPGNFIKPEEIMKEDFSTEYSIADAIKNNPVLFFNHIWYNFLRLSKNFIAIYPFFLIQNKIKFTQTFLYFISFILLLLLFLLLYFIFERIRKKKMNIQILIYFLYLMPPFISILIFYPRVHYIILIFAFVLIYLSYEISVRNNSSEIVKKYTFTVSIITGIFLIFTVPFRASSESIHQSNCTTLKTVFAIKNLNFRKDINFLSIGPIISAYIEKEWNCITDETLESPLDNFIQKNNINLILADDIFINHPIIKKENFLNKIYNDTSFVKLNIPGCNSFLIARKSILNQ